MKRTVYLFKKGVRVKQRTFSSRKDSLPWEESDWLHNQLQDLLGIGYSLEKVGRFFDFIECSDVDEFKASNSDCKHIVVKIYYYEDSECD